MQVSKRITALTALTLITFFISTGHLCAETMYVSDVLKLSLRSGPSLENRILAILESGQRVEIIEQGPKWSQVELPNGKKGWVLSRYLTPNETHNIILERLQKEHQATMTRAAELAAENEQLASENKQLKADLTASQNELELLRGEFQTLKQDASEYLDLKSKFENMSTEYADQAQQLQSLKGQLSKIETSHYIKWFLAGSGVLVLGFLIGLSTRRQRRRSTL
jgi:SH3 domain protein